MTDANATEESGSVFSVWSRQELEDNFVSVLVMLQEVFHPQTDGVTVRFVDLLNEIETEECHLLKDLAREIWREEDYEPEEWEDMRKKLGL